MKKTIVFSVIYLITHLSILSQNRLSDNIVGTNHIIDSKELSEERKIKIYLPEGYEDNSEKKYPVLYLLDGQRFFLYGVSLSLSFKQFDLTPEFIIVGIENSYPKRFSHFSSGKEKFIGFIEKELIPYVDKNYRTKDENLLFGWEYGGSLTFNIMLEQPALFEGYFMASPFPIKEKAEDLNSISELNKMLFYSVSPDEFAVNQGVEKLSSVLDSHNIEGLEFTFFPLELEKHRSTAYPTLYHGIRKYFEYYPQLEVNNLQKFLDKGGLKYAYEYTQKRANSFGFENKLSYWSKYTIVRSAIRAENFDQFEKLFNDLGSKGFIMELLNKKRSYEISEIALNYENNKKFQKAIDILLLLIEKHPDSERLHNRIAKAYESLGNKKEAKKYFNIAKELSKSEG